MIELHHWSTPDCTRRPAVPVSRPCRPSPHSPIPLPAAVIAAPRDWRMVLVGLLAASALASHLTFMMPGPLLTPIATELRLPEATIGQMATLQSLIAAVAAIIAAPLLARHQHRAIFRVKFGVLILGTVMSVLAPSFTWLMIGRGLAGLGGAFIVATCLATIGHLFPDPVGRNRAVGIVVAMGAVAGSVGIGVVGHLATQWGWRVALAAILVPLGVGLLATCFLPRRIIATAGPDRRRWVGGYQRVLGSRRVRLLLGISAIIFLIRGGAFIYFSGFALARFGADLSTISTLLLVGGLTEVIACLALPVVLRRWHGPWLSGGLAVLGIVTLGGVAFLGGNVWWLALFLASISLVVSGLGFMLNLWLLEVMPAETDAVLALQASAWEIGWATGALAAGLALALGGFGAIYPTLAVFLPLALAGLILLGRDTPAAVAAPAAA